MVLSCVFIASGEHTQEENIRSRPDDTLGGPEGFDGTIPHSPDWHYEGRSSRTTGTVVKMAETDRRRA